MVLCLDNSYPVVSFLANGEEVWMRLDILPGQPAVAAAARPAASPPGPSQGPQQQPQLQSQLQPQRPKHHQQERGKAPFTYKAALVEGGSVVSLTQPAVGAAPAATAAVSAQATPSSMAGLGGGGRPSPASPTEDDPAPPPLVHQVNPDASSLSQGLLTAAPRPQPAQPQCSQATSFHGSGQPFPFPVPPRKGPDHVVGCWCPS